MIRKLLLTATVAVTLPAAAIDRYVPGSESDPHVRSAEFLIGDQRYFSAATELLQILGEKPDRRLSPAFYRRLADATLNFGITQRAETIYRELGANPANALSVARARIRVAEFLYQRGRYSEAVADLEAVRNGLPKEAVLEWQDLLGRALLAQGRYADAVKVLSEIKDAGPQKAFTRFNLGVALIKDGQVTKGVSTLDRVGQINAVDSDELALRDKANLVLGYWFLRQQQAGTAINVLQRVRSDGPMSNRALLGLGWAYLAPTGKRQKKEAVPGDVPDEVQRVSKSLSTIGVLLRPGFLDDDIYRRAGLQSFRLTKASPEEEAALKRALVPWVELVGRDPTDPAVQEGLLAIPFTLEKLGAHIQAQQFYEQAIAALEAGRKRIDETSYYVKSGRMISTMVRRTADAESGWAWELKDLPDAEETYYLQNLIAGNRFQEQLKNYRDSLLLKRNLENWATRSAELQSAWLARQGISVPTEALLARPLNQPADGSAAAPVVPTPPVLLQSSASLTAADGSTAPVVDGKAASLPLQTAGSPGAGAFVGTYEKLDLLKARVDTLLPQAKSLNDRQARMLEKLAQDNLADQRNYTSKYLIEARFALARIYDQQIKGDAP